MTSKPIPAKNAPTSASKTRIAFLDCGSLVNTLDTRPIDDIAEWVNYTDSSNKEIIERGQGAAILAINKVIIDEVVLRSCPSVKHIAVAATGYDAVDVAACKKHGVSVSNIPNYATVSVSEHVIAMAISLRRELLQYRQQVIANRWQASPDFCLFDKPISDLNNSVFGVIGFGQLGQATARLANALGMKVIYHSRSEHQSDFAKHVSLHQLLIQSDIVSLHCSLTAETKNLIAAAELAIMKPNAILINTARGGVVNEAAVVDAVKRNIIGGIGFDVLSEEPPQDDSPLLTIANRTNVVITPHVAWASQAAVANLCNILVGNVNAFINGQARNLVV